jgi:hypothetical protein
VFLPTISILIPHCYKWSLVQSGYSTFHIVLLPTTGLLITMHLTTMAFFDLKVDIQHFMCSCQQLASSILCTSLMQADLWSKVDIQHFNVSSCQQLASSILYLTTMQLIFWSKEIFNI